MSEKGLALVKAFEGCYLEAYVCPAGVLTIGYGHTDNVEKGQTITKEQADRFLIKDVTWAEDVVERHVRVPLSAYQFDALTSFVFNVGEGAFKGSTLLRELNKGRYEAVPAQLLRWNKAGSGKKKRVLAGLTRRRHAEAALWSEVPLPAQPDKPEAAPEPMPQAVCPSTPPVTDLAKSGTIQATGLGGLALITDIFWGTVTDASKQTAESLDATASLRNALGISGKALVYIALACLIAAGARRVAAHYGGKIG
jgi:lysozyme